jgi:hypothetical protein
MAFERCAACGLVFLSPRYSADTLARFYGVPLEQRASRRMQPADSDSNPRYERRVRARFDRLAGLVRRHRSEVKLVVDVGASDGASLQPFLAAGAQAVAIDPALQAGANARWEVYPGLEALKAEGLKPDVVLSMQTFEHLLSPRAMARTAIETMADDGLLVVEVPYDLQWMNFVTNMSEPTQAGHGGHINFFTSDSLTRMSASWGASIVEVRVGAQIKQYGGLVPSITLVARPDRSGGEASAGALHAPLQSLATILDRDRRLVRRAQQRERALGFVARRGSW